MDLVRQEALASRRGKVIVEVKDEAYNQWASRWLSFQRRASRAFSDLEFNIQCETPENSNFLKECKIVISVKIQNFSRSQMTKRISPLELSCEI